METNNALEDGRKGKSLDYENESPVKYIRSDVSQQKNQELIRENIDKQARIKRHHQLLKRWKVEFDNSCNPELRTEFDPSLDLYEQTEELLKDEEE